MTFLSTGVAKFVNGTPLLLNLSMSRICITQGHRYLKSSLRLIRPCFHRAFRCSSPSLQWHHNECEGVSNHRHLDCLLNRLFRRRSKKTSKIRDTGLCEGNSPVTGEFPLQRASNAEDVSIWWRHHDYALVGSPPSLGYHIIYQCHPHTGQYCISIPSQKCIGNHIDKAVTRAFWRSIFHPSWSDRNPRHLCYLQNWKMIHLKKWRASVH